MKPFALWLLGTLAAFGALSGAYHLALEESPRKVMVIVDSSYPMSEAWHRVPKILRDLGDRRYSLFALYSERGRIHGWQDRLTLSQVRPYGPRDFAKLRDSGALGDVAEAGAVLFVTNAPAGELDPFDDWQILRP